jgi:HSP20 family protein
MFGTMTGFPSLFDNLSRLQRELDDTFGTWPYPTELRSPGRGGWPAMNVGATSERVDVYLFAPGLDPSQLDISIQQNVLTISGERRIERAEGIRPYRSERFSGEFRRAVTLPDDVDPDRVDATYRDGVLHVSVQRKQAAQPKRITVG